MRLFGKKKTIHVEFVDEETGLIFAQSDIPLENLPETFALNTQMHLGDNNWMVVSAKPMNSSEFRQTGKLRLVLQKIKIMDPANLLYTLPSICNFLGEVDEESEAVGSELTIHEDSWRNTELVSYMHRNEIDVNLREIYRIHQEQRKGHGFQTLYLRENIEQPLASISLPFKELEKFKKTRNFSGLSYLDSNRVVTNGYAFSTIGGITWYGRQKNNLVQEFCIAHFSPNEQTEQEIEILATIMRNYGLNFIDWCNMVLVDSEEEDNLKSYFLPTHNNRN